MQSLDAAVSFAPGIAEAWNNRGNALSALGRYDEAVASYDKVLAARPGMFEALVNRGTALLSSRRQEEALESYGEALRLHPDSADALNGRANASFELKHFEDAIRDYKTLLKLSPEHEYAAGNLAFRGSIAAIGTILKQTGSCLQPASVKGNAWRIPFNLSLCRRVPRIRSVAPRHGSRTNARP